MIDDNKFIRVLDVMDDNDPENYNNRKFRSMIISMPKCDNKVITIDKHELVKRYLDNCDTYSIKFSGLEPLDNTPYSDDNGSYYYPLETDIYKQLDMNIPYASSFTDIIDLLTILKRDYKCKDTIIIYTGYNHYDLYKMTDNHGCILVLLNLIKSYGGNLIIKYGEDKDDGTITGYPGGLRFHGWATSILGTVLKSSNQYVIAYAYRKLNSKKLKCKNKKDKDKIRLMYYYETKNKYIVGFDDLETSWEIDENNRYFTIDETTGEKYYGKYEDYRKQQEVFDKYYQMVAPYVWEKAIGWN